MEREVTDRVESGAARIRAPREDAMSRSRFLTASVLLTLSLMLWQFAWAFSAPALRGPDEPMHVNSIMRLATTGTWPAPGEAMVTPNIITASRQAGLLQPEATDYRFEHRYLLHGSEYAGLTPDVGQAEVVPHAERTAFGAVPPHPPGATVIDQMTQHPPLYYALGAALTKACGLDRAPWDEAVLTLRMLSVFLLIPLTPCLIYTARRLGAPRPWALAAGLIPVAIPQVYHIGTMVTNDALATGAGALVMAALAKAGTERISWRTISLVGLSLGFALWSKGQILVFGLPLIVVFALRPEPWVTRLKAIIASGTMSLLIGWWWIANLVRYHTIQPAGYPAEINPNWDPSQADLGHFLSTAADSFNRSFWASYGWLEVTYHPLWLRTLLTIGLIALALIGTWRCAQPRTGLALGLTIIGLLALIFGQAWVGPYTGAGYVAGVQGRYAFPLLVALAVIVFAFRRRWQLVAFAVACLASGAIGLIELLRACYQSANWWMRPDLAEAQGVGMGTARLVMTLGTLGALAALAIVLASARFAPPYLTAPSIPSSGPARSGVSTAQ